MANTLEDYIPAVEEFGLKTKKPIPLQPITDISPQDGDFWQDGANLNFRMNGVTYIIGGASNPALSINFTSEFLMMGA